MKAMVIVKDEGGGTLAWRDVPDPTPGPGEILLRIREAQRYMTTNAQIARSCSVGSTLE